MESFQYVAPVTQTLTIEVVAQDTLQSAALSIFSAAGSPLLFAPGEIGQSTTEVSFAVVAGATYRFDVAAGPASLPGGLSGPFRLVFDDFSDQISNAFPLANSPDGATIRQTGAIDPIADFDWFQFTPPVSGLLTASVNASAGSSFQGVVLVEDSTGLHSASDASAATGALVSEITDFLVEAGKTYYVRVSGADAATIERQTGNYSLTLSIDRFTPGHSVGTATALDVSALGAATVNWLISTAGVADYYRYVAPETGEVIVREEAPEFSQLDTLLSGFDAAGNPLPGGRSDDARWIDSQGQTRFGSEVKLSVVAGDSYVIEAGAFGESTGAYVLSILPDASNDALEDRAAALSLASGLVQNNRLDFVSRR